jgi:HK97 family phage major capsid protein/HK97 family phage prohead protease
MKKKFYKTIQAYTKDIGEGIIEAIVSTEDIDRHGEKVKLDGIDLKNYKKNPVVLWAHDYSSLPIAKTVSLRKTAEGLVAKMEFAINEYPFARQVYELLKGKYLNAFSIGFMAFEGEGNTFTKTELLEYSVVAVPANANALAKAHAKGLDTTNISCYPLEELEKINLTNSKTMYILKDVLAKELNDLTVGEIAFLKGETSNMTESEKAKFASVLVEKDVVSEMKSLLADQESKMDEKLKALKADLDPVEKKAINTVADPNKIGAKKKEVSKEKAFYMFAKAVITGNTSRYRKDVMNTTDDVAVLPPQDFVAEVERLIPQYGVARRNARFIRSTKGKGVQMIIGDDTLRMTDTAEGGKKTSTKLGYTEFFLTWRKIAGILPMTDELEEDSAIDLFRDASNMFAREVARNEDVFVFTRVKGVGEANANVYPGLLELEVADGVNIITLATDSILTGLNFDKIIDAMYAISTAASTGAKWYFNRTLLGVLQKIKDLQDNYIWKPGVNGPVDGTIWGAPYELVEVMPGVAEDGADKAFMAYGNLDYVTLGERTQLKIELFNTGTVADVDNPEVYHNLLLEDKKALRAVKRLNARVRFPSAFAIIKTGTASS